MLKLEDLDDSRVYTHVEDGGQYQYLGRVKVKQPDGSWLEHVEYFDMLGDSGTYARTPENFCERFKESE